MDDDGDHLVSEKEFLDAATEALASLGQGSANAAGGAVQHRAEVLQTLDRYSNFLYTDMVGLGGCMEPGIRYIDPSPEGEHCGKPGGGYTVRIHMVRTLGSICSCMLVVARRPGSCQTTDRTVHRWW